MRFVAALLWVALILAGCGSGGGASGSPVSSAPNIPVGFSNGALYDALGDSVTAPYPSPNQSIVTYPQVAIALAGLSMQLHDLADGHANFISSYQSCHSGASGPIASQISRIDPTAGFITVEIGIDEATARAEDVLQWHCRQATAADDADAMLTAYRQVYAQIRAAAPFAQIVLFNDANIAHFPCSNSNDPANYQIFCTAPFSPWYVDLIKGIDQLYQPNGGLTIVDTACDAALYDPSNFIGTGLLGLHPNQTGQNEIANKLLFTVRNPSVAPAADCPYLH